MQCRRQSTRADDDVIMSAITEEALVFEAGKDFIQLEVHVRDDVMTEILFDNKKR